MTTLDWVILALVGLSALSGLRRGLLGTALSLAGLIGGAVLGERLAPRLLSGGNHSPYTPVLALAGAAAGAFALRAVAELLASFARGGLRLLPPLRMLDALGGLLAGTAFGVAGVWVLGAVALQLPGQATLRRDVQRSLLLRQLNQIAPPGEVLDALARFDILPVLSAPSAPSAPPDPRVLASSAVRAARPSVVRVTAQACGLGVEGSGWVAEPHLVVTAGHVVAGASGIRVDGDAARVFALDRAADVAVLDVPALRARPLPFGAARPGAAVAILGYPLDGSFRARPGRIVETLEVLLNGQHREVTALSGLVQHGDSGGPAIDGAGVVEATIFAATPGSQNGFGVPTQAVQAALGAARGPVPTGSC